MSKNKISQDESIIEKWIWTQNLWAKVKTIWTIKQANSKNVLLKIVVSSKILYRPNWYEYMYLNGPKVKLSEQQMHTNSAKISEFRHIQIGRMDLC